jgi:hypothetical protein
LGREWVGMARLNGWGVGEVLRFGPVREGVRAVRGE